MGSTTQILTRSALTQFPWAFLAGDGRNDSPGHSAQYCTYSLLEHTTKDLVAVIVVDKRETALKSSTMEVAALKRGLDSLKEKGCCVEEVTTDAHPQIAHLFSKYAIQ